MKRELTCIGCPMGCGLLAEYERENGKVEVSSVTGNECNIGKKYALEELSNPTRMVTSLVKVCGRNEPLTVKTSKPIDKTKIDDCLAEIKKARAITPLKIGEVIIKGVCDTDVDIIATRELA